MAYRDTPIIKHVDPQIVGSGLHEDLHSLQKLLWDVAENVTFYQGKVQRLLPPSNLHDFGTLPVRGISQRQDSGGTRWIWAASGGDVKRWNGVTEENILTGATWQDNETSIQDATQWDFTHYGDWTLINSSQGAAQLHKSALDINPIAQAPTDVVRFMKKLDFLLAIGHDATGTKISWTASGNIEQWNEAEMNEAGSLGIEELDTRIKSAQRLGQHIACYAEDQLALVTFINAPFYFGGRVVLDGIGAVSKFAVAAMGLSNFGVGRNGIWWTDSTDYRYIDEGVMRDYFQENVNWAQKSKIFAVRNDITNCIEFFFPMGVNTDISEGWSFDPRNNGWSKLPPVSFKNERKVLDNPLEGDETGQVKLSAEDPNVAGALSLRTKPMPAQLQDRHGLTDVHIDCEAHEYDLLLKAATNIQVRIGASTEPNGTISWGVWQNAEIGAKTYRVPTGVPSGVYHFLEFQSTATNWDLNLQGFMIFGKIEGSKRDGIT